MKKIAIFAAILLLSACSPAPQPAASQPDVIGTAAAAQVELERARLAMTATEAARIAPMTQQAAQIQIQQTAQAATSTAEYVALVASWTPTPNYTAIVASAEAEAAIEQIRIETEQRRLALERERKTNTVYAMLPPTIVISLLFIAVMFGIGMARKLSAIPLPTNSKGEAIPVVVDGKVIDALPKRLPAPTAIKPALLPAPKPETESASEEPEPAQISAFTLPEWTLLNSWDGDKGIPYGVSQRGLQFVSAETHPHIATIGKTGSGKSRWFLRPFLTGALAAGHRVVVLGKSADFHVFKGHPNAHLVIVRDFTRDDESERYAMRLRAMIEEMNKRDEYLTSSHHSTWAQAGREATYIVLDELGNALDMMPRDTREQTLRYVKGLANEGRKVGFHLVMATQRAVGFRNIITQVGRAVFFVEDEQESRFAIGIPGAESLTPGYFYARFGMVQIAGAFQPSDNDISRFLQSRSVKPLPPVNWLEGEIVEGKQETSVEQIRSLFAAGEKLTKIQQTVFGTTGGADFYKVKAAIGDVGNPTPT